MVRLISRQRGGLAALKLTKLFGIDDFPAAKDAGKVLIIIIYCYLIIIIIIIVIVISLTSAPAATLLTINHRIDNEWRSQSENAIYDNKLVEFILNTSSIGLK